MFRLHARRHRNHLLQMVNGIVREKKVSGSARARAVNYGYEEAIKTLNSLQTNENLLEKIKEQGKLTHSATVSRTLEQTEKYLLRSGTSFDQLDQLSVIHVAGTKGKGSTCAFCESILRNHGYRTGFFSSPHLVSVRERIQIDGKPIERDTFAGYFWDVYDKLKEKREYQTDMPPYFKFLTVLAFNVFLREQIDVAIVEVGIGGEYDCTNILRKVPVVGISSLEIEHTNILGSTIQEIAWQKAGIMKKNSRVFAVEQSDEAMAVLKERSAEKQTVFHIVPPFDSYEWDGPAPNINGVQKMNASLAIQLANAWMKLRERRSRTKISTQLPLVHRVSAKMAAGLVECTWPGRYQILKTPQMRLFLDGAHTIDSLKHCIRWFDANSNSSSDPKVLIFNVTGDRDSEQLLSILIGYDFERVMFVPNRARSENGNYHDAVNLNNTDRQQMARCETHKGIWLNKTANSPARSKQHVTVYSNVLDALRDLPVGEKHDVLVTGSLHLVGAVLSLFDVELSATKKSAGIIG